MQTFFAVVEFQDVTSTIYSDGHFLVGKTEIMKDIFPIECVVNHKSADMPFTASLHKVKDQTLPIG